MRFGERIDDIEVLVDVHERAMKRAKDRQRVRVLRGIGIECRGFAGKGDPNDLLGGQAT